MDQLSQGSLNNNSQRFFEFLQNFLSESLSDFTIQNLSQLMGVLVKKVMDNHFVIQNLAEKFTKEFKEFKGKTLDLSAGPRRKVSAESVPPEKRLKKSSVVAGCNQTIGRVINIVRYLTEHPYLTGMFVDCIE